jgi:hypothetical protein
LFQAQVQSQHPDAAVTFALASSAAADITDDYVREDVLCFLATVQAQTGEWTEVQTTINAISNKGLRAKALSALAQAQAQAGLWTEAQTSIDAITEDKERAESLSVLAQSQAQAGLWTESQTTIDAITEDKERAESLSVLAQAQAQERHPEASISFALAATFANIPNDSSHNYSLKELAVAQAQSGLWAEAQTTINVITDNRRRAEALRDLAVAQTQARHPDAGINFALAASAAAASTENSYPSRNYLLKELAVAQARAGLWIEAQTTIDTITEDKEHADVLRTLAAAQAQAGLWTEAQTTIDTITEDKEHAVALRALAAAQAQAGLWTEAQTSIDTITEDKERAESLSVLAQSQAQAGLWTEAQTTIDAITDEVERAESLSALAAATFALAATTAAAITEDSSLSRSYAFKKLALGQAQAGLWTEAHATITTITDDWTRTQALSALAQMQAQAGHPDVSATFALAATTAASLRYVGESALLLEDLHKTLLQIGHTAAVRQSIVTAWRMATTYKDLLSLAKIAYPLLSTDSVLGQEMVAAFTWVDDQLREI